MEGQNHSLERGAETSPKNITAAERRVELETKIAGTTFIDRGLALSEIHRDRLFEPDFGSFEQYCTGKWPFGYKYAYRLIAAAQFARDFSPFGEISKESHARTLLEIPEGDRVAVFRVATAAAAAERRRLSVRHILEAAGSINEKPPSPLKRLHRAWIAADAFARNEFLVTIGLGHSISKRSNRKGTSQQQTFGFSEPEEGEAK